MLETSQSAQHFAEKVNLSRGLDSSVLRQHLSEAVPAGPLLELFAK